MVAKPDNVVQSAFMHEKFLDDSGEVPLVVATRQELSSFNIWEEELILGSVSDYNVQ